MGTARGESRAGVLTQRHHMASVRSIEESRQAELIATDTHRHVDPSQRGILLDALRDVVSPRLYRTNAFRVLGLSVSDNKATVRQQLQKLKIRERIGDTRQEGQSEVLPLQPLPDSDAIRSADQRLHDVQSQLVDEFFWFWPATTPSTNGGDAYTLLKAGDISGAHRGWSSLSSSHPDWPAATHNLAVLHHALALDMEWEISRKTSVDSDLLERLDGHWKAALNSWAITIDDEQVWTHLAARAQALNDPRLTSGFVPRLRQSLPAAISSISVDLAVRAAQRGDADRAKRHMAYIRESGFDRELIDGLLDREAASFLDQIRRICEPVPARCKDAPAEAHWLAETALGDSKALLIGMRALLAEEHPLWQKASELVGTTVKNCLVVYCDAVAERSKHAAATADQLARSVLEESKALLAEIRVTFDEGYPLWQAVSDLVAEAVHECMIEYGYETENWDQCIPVLEQASRVAVGDEWRAQLRRDIDQADERHKRQPADETRRNGQSVLGGSAELFAGLVVILGVVALIVSLVHWWSSGSSPSEPTQAGALRLSQQVAAPAPSYTNNLLARIDSGKARVQALESEIKQMDSELEQLSVSIARHKRGIEGYERLVGSGKRPDELACRQTVENHNRLTDQHNSLLSGRNAKYSEYQREIASVNDMIARYNRGER